MGASKIASMKDLKETTSPLGAHVPEPMPMLPAKLVGAVVRGLPKPIQQGRNSPSLSRKLVDIVVGAFPLGTGPHWLWKAAAWLSYPGGACSLA